MDFGAGPKALHTAMLRKKGFKRVSSHEIWLHFNPEIHDRRAVKKKYDIVMASNVLNVQGAIPEVVSVILQLAWLTRLDGCMICNLPKAPLYPRYLTPAYMAQCLLLGFNTVTTLGKKHAKRNHVWLCTEPMRCMGTPRGVDHNT